MLGNKLSLEPTGTAHFVGIPWQHASQLSSPGPFFPGYAWNEQFWGSSKHFHPRQSSGFAYHLP
jgi:hypothetical protein